MTAQQAARRCIQQHEGLRLMPYLCPSARATIGWGHVLRDEEGKPLLGQSGLTTARRRYPDGITIDQARDFLDADLAVVAMGVGRLVAVPLTAMQQAALLSFAYNVGLGNLATSTLLQKLNAGDYAAVPAELARWKHGGGKVLHGLVRRREAEAALWRTPDAP